MGAPMSGATVAVARHRPTRTPRLTRRPSPCAPSGARGARYGGPAAGQPVDTAGTSGAGAAPPRRAGLRSPAGSEGTAPR